MIGVPCVCFSDKNRDGANIIITMKITNYDEIWIKNSINIFLFRMKNLARFQLSLFRMKNCCSFQLFPFLCEIIIILELLINAVKHLFHELNHNLYKFCYKLDEKLDNYVLICNNS